MNKTIKALLALVVTLSVSGVSYGQPERPAAEEQTVTFVFRPGSDMFLLKGNEAELERLYALVDEHHTEIAAGKLPVYVDGYCASLPTASENLRTAFVRANLVKSELIIRKGLKEADFVTANYAESYDGRKDVVVVRLRIPSKEEPGQPAPPEPKPEPVEPSVEVVQQPEPAVEKEPVSQPEPMAVAEPLMPAKPYCLAVRTNLLYDAFLLPTLGVEWRVNRDLGIKLDGSFALWGGKIDGDDTGDMNGKAQKMWLLNPEVRWYLLPDKRFYVGASGSYGQYNIYKYPLGNLFKNDAGYQGNLWSAGVTVGYQVRLSRNFLADFNLGLGYTRLDYDRFVIMDGLRLYKKRGVSRDFWGPTQAGVNLVWTIGGNK